jgi:hypothetical protein
MTRFVRHASPVIWAILFVGGMIALLALDATAREVAHDALQWIFVFFSTPFILETTCALIFLALLLCFNRWRLHKEGDGWVYLLAHEPDEKNLPAAITQRLQSTVLPEKPEPLDEDQAAAAVVEGYLELGMAAQALDEMNRRSTGSRSLVNTLLRVRVLAANMDRDAALGLIRQTATDPATHRVLASVILDSARWILQHVHDVPAVKAWIGEARALDPGAVGRISAADTLAAHL